MGTWLPISYRELNNVIGKLKSRSAAGRDFINNWAISNLPPNIIHLLVKIFNKFMYNGIIPSSWTDFDVCMIPKPSGSFRKISLASCFLKNSKGVSKIDWIFSWKLNWFFLYYNLVSARVNPAQIIQLLSLPTFTTRLRGKNKLQRHFSTSKARTTMSFLRHWFQILVMCAYLTVSNS